MEKGIVCILTGASSVGKGQIRDLLLADEELNLIYSISMTTRKPKEGEVDGKDYYFVDLKSFAEAIKNGELLEYTMFNNDYYGTPKNQVEFLVQHGKSVLIEVEAQGVGSIEDTIPESFAVFVKPESFEQLIDQIHARYGDDTTSAKNRINKATVEMEMLPLFNHVVSNEDPQKAYLQIKDLIKEKRG